MGWDEGGEALPDRLEGINVEGNTNAYNQQSPNERIREGAGWTDLNRNQISDLSGPRVCKDPLI